MAQIMVRFREPGFHKWPEAPDRRDYLRDKHRHLFHVEVRMAVHHNEREVEFHDLIDAARGRFSDALMMSNCSSCETLAEYVARSLAQQFNRVVVCEVWEDGECGAQVSAGGVLL